MLSRLFGKLDAAVAGEEACASPPVSNSNSVTGFGMVSTTSAYPTPSKASCLLPPGWEAKFDKKTSTYFYVNHQLKVMSWIPPDPNVQPGTHATKDSDPPDAEDEKEARQREVMAYGVSPMQAVQEKMPGAEDSIQDSCPLVSAADERVLVFVNKDKTVRSVRAETAGAADSTEDSCPLVSAANEGSCIC